MTEQTIRDMLDDFATERRKAVAFARYCREQAPQWCIGSALFGEIRWEMEPADNREFEGAYLLLQSRGYR